MPMLAWIPYASKLGMYTYVCPCARGCRNQLAAGQALPPGVVRIRSWAEAVEKLLIILKQLGS